MTTQMVPLDQNGNEITNGAMGGFQGSAADVGALALHAGTAGAVAREEAELKAAIVLARTNPRDELRAYTKIVDSCKRPAFAAKTTYRFPRGGATIEGPTVKLAREMARCWGNIHFGFRVVSEDAQRIHIKGFAFDMETGTKVEAEDKFVKLIQRKNGWVAPDERDLRELVNRRASFCVRNCILSLIPPDVTDDAVKKAKETQKLVADGELTANPVEVVRRMVLAFADLQVSQSMVEKFLGHTCDKINGDELAELRQIFEAIRDKQAKREEFFDVEEAKADVGKSIADTLASKHTKKNNPIQPAATTDPATEPVVITEAPDAGNGQDFDDIADAMPDTLIPEPPKGRKK